MHFTFSPMFIQRGPAHRVNCKVILQDKLWVRSKLVLHYWIYYPILFCCSATTGNRSTNDYISQLALMKLQLVVKLASVCGSCAAVAFPS